MNWKLFLAAVVAAGFVSSLTDWFFGGFLFHDKYMSHPEVWRIRAGQSETRAVTGSVLLGFVTCAAFVGAYVLFHLHGFAAAFELAGIVWLMVPLPLLITDALFIKLHPLNIVSNSLGWGAKLSVAAVAAAMLLS